MSRRMEDLNPTFCKMADAFIAEFQQTTGLQLLVTSTRRWTSEQEALYAIGRTRPGRIVTNARPGSSAHEYGLALDAVPVFPGGKLAYNTPEGDSVADPVWQEYGRIAQRHGLVWGGTWERFREGPHVEMPNWREFAGLKDA